MRKRGRLRCGGKTNREVREKRDKAGLLDTGVSNRVGDKER